MGDMSRSASPEVADQGAISPSSKRRKLDDPSQTASTSKSTLESPPSASELAHGLKAASPDSLRTSLTSLRQYTALASNETVAANDARLNLARSLLEEESGRERLFTSWDRTHEVSMPQALIRMEHCIDISFNSRPISGQVWHRSITAVTVVRSGQLDYAHVRSHARSPSRTFPD